MQFKSNMNECTCKIETNRFRGFTGGSLMKNLPVNVGDVGSIPGSGGSPGGGDGNLLQDSCLENPMDRGAWQAIVYGVTKSWTRLSNHTEI